MKKNIKFPEDFKSRPHPVFGGGVQYGYPSFEEGNFTISVVCAKGIACSNGVDTFEMYDFREVDVRGYMTKEQINEHLKNNPI